MHKWRVFFKRMFIWHHFKYINFREIFVILHAFFLWHNLWANERIHIISDNNIIINAINKHFIKNSMIKSLQSILLVITIFDIDLMAFWISFEKNIVIDIAFHFDFKKLIELNFQISSSNHSNSSMSSLYQKLHFFFIISSHSLLDEIITPFINSMNSSIEIMIIYHSLSSSQWLSNSTHVKSQIRHRQKLYQRNSFLSSQTQFLYRNVQWFPSQSSHSR